MEMMKAVADVESVPEIKARRIPSPKIKNVDNFKISSKKAKVPSKAPKIPKIPKGSVHSKAKVHTSKDDELFHVIGNPVKMSDEPVADDERQPKKSSKKKKNKKKNKKSNKKKWDDASSDGSFSVSSYGGSYLGSLGSLGSFDPNDDLSDSERSFGSGSSFEGRQHYTARKRKEEIMQEKIEMLTRISNMSRMGFTATRKWSMKDELDEIRFECYRMTRENNSRKAVKNMQHMLITAATIVEFANSIVNPFNLKLQGFSKNLMLTVSDYDDSLEELHHKWSGRTSVGPELTVLFTFVTSAIFHHAGNVMSSPNDSSEQSAPKSRGPDMSSMLGLFSNMMPKTSVPKMPPKTSGPVASESSSASESKESTSDSKKRRPMKGPSGAGVPFANIMPSLQIP